MESMRDVNRVMEREIKKGSSPLKLDHIEFGDYSYQEIMSQEKLFEVLTYLLRIRFHGCTDSRQEITRYRRCWTRSMGWEVRLQTHFPVLCRGIYWLAWDAG